VEQTAFVGKRKSTLLGTASDVDVAEMLGVTKTSVFGKRKHLGVPALYLSGKQVAHRWTERELGWLGKLTDSDIAERIGVDSTTVTWKRRVLGIGPKSPTKKGRQWTKKELKSRSNNSSASLRYDSSSARFDDRLPEIIVDLFRHQVGLKAV